jgi:hypothetical protein
MYALGKKVLLCCECDHYDEQNKDCGICRRFPPIPTEKAPLFLTVPKMHPICGEFKEETI